MLTSSAEDFITILGQACHARERLILAIGPASAGKTAWLRDVAGAHSLKYLPIGKPLARTLVELSPRQRPLSMGRELDAILADEQAGVCLDNTDLLFLPELRCDPLRLVSLLAQHRLVVAAFTGEFLSGRFTRAYPDHPEYFSRRLSGVTVAAFSSGQPSFFQT